MTKAAMNGKEKDDSVYGTRGDFVEVDAAGLSLPNVLGSVYSTPARTRTVSSLAALARLPLAFRLVSILLTALWRTPQIAQLFLS